jgi:hypothetical protein
MPRLTSEARSRELQDLLITDLHNSRREKQTGTSGSPANRKGGKLEVLNLLIPALPSSSGGGACDDKELGKQKKMCISGILRFSILGISLSFGIHILD